MKKIILLIFVLIGIAVAGYFFWQNRYDYFFQEEGGGQNEKEEKLQEELTTEKESGLKNEFDAEEETETRENSEKNNQEESENVPFSPQKDFTPEDYCSKNCEEYQSNQKEYEYCREICGFNDWQIEDEKVKEEECDSKEGQARDFCFRQKAIVEKNMSFCEKIKDAKIKESCQNRVIEEIFY